MTRDIRDGQRPMAKGYSKIETSGIDRIGKKYCMGISL